MPCHDDYAEKQELQLLKARLDITTRLACLYCGNLDAMKIDIPSWASGWWTRHKQIDKDRLQEEERKLEVKKTYETHQAYKKEILSKLTPQERRDLGHE